jgi:hypothetical protein
MRRKHLLDDLNETRGYGKQKEETVYVMSGEFTLGEAMDGLRNE